VAPRYPNRVKLATPPTGPRPLATPPAGSRRGQAASRPGAGSSQADSQPLLTQAGTDSDSVSERRIRAILVPGSERAGGTDGDFKFNFSAWPPWCHRGGGNTRPRTAGCPASPGASLWIRSHQLQVERHYPSQLQSDSGPLGQQDRSSAARAPDRPLTGSCAGLCWVSYLKVNRIGSFLQGSRIYFHVLLFLQGFRG
jgi:hypothetical protein